MKKFSEFGIETASKSFIGTKTEMDNILNNKIMVHAFRIVESKYAKDKSNGKCLHLQIMIGAAYHVVFTGSGALMDQIQQVPENGFPFESKIIKENKRLIFT